MKINEIMLSIIFGIQIIRIVIITYPLCDIISEKVFKLDSNYCESRLSVTIGLTMLSALICTGALLSANDVLGKNMINSRNDELMNAVIIILFIEFILIKLLKELVSMIINLTGHNERNDKSHEKI
jgi:hypothetical protein